jgi:hypothetical protein
MTSYPLLVKITDSDRYRYRDECGMYVTEYRNLRTTYTVILCSDEYAEVVESCATSDDCKRIQKMGPIAFDEMRDLGTQLITVATIHDRKSAVRCPFCASDDIRTEGYNEDARHIFETCRCFHCDRSWQNTFQFVDHEVNDDE